MELLAYVFFTVPYLLALLLGLAVPAFIFMAYNRLGWGLTLIALAWLGDLLSMSEPLLRLGITIYPADLPMLLLAVVVALRWILGGEIANKPWYWLIMLLVFVGNLAWGLAVNGTTAGVQARPDFYALVAGSYVLSFKVDEATSRLLMRALIGLGVSMLLLSVYRWVVYYTPITALLPPGGVYNIDGAIRVVPSNSALLLAELAVVGMVFVGGAVGLRRTRLLVPFFLAFVLVLQHRSVWLAAIVGFAVGLLVGRAQKVPMWQQVFLSVVVIAAAMAPLLFSSVLSSQLQSSAQRAVAGQGTVSERIQNWQATLKLWTGDGPLAIAIGRARGADSKRTVFDEAGRSRDITYNAHNHYVNQVTGLGLIGFSMYLLVIIRVLRGLLSAVRRKDANTPTAALLLVLMATQLAYFVAYGSDMLQYLILGWALAWVLAQPRATPSVSGKGFGIRPLVRPGAAVPKLNPDSHRFL